jgi:type 1 glutamine amidotransferase
MAWTRRSLIQSAGSLVIPAAAHAAGKHVVYVCGDHEYGGEQTLPLFAREFDQRFGSRHTLLTTKPDQNGETDLPGLEALGTADLAIFFLRWRRLPAEQVAHIDKYMKSGRPMFGFRTTSHSFRYEKGHPLEPWNGWGADAFGSPPGWGADGHTHFGHQASTDVRINPDKSRHPVLQGVAKEFHVRSWLYRVLPKWPPEDAEKLLVGKCLNPNKPAEDNPVAWTWRNKHGGKIFFTTLGHPEDFAVEAFQRVCANAALWLLGQPVPRRWKGRMPIDVPYRGMVKTG